jgi:hypothetical protein
VIYNVSRKTLTHRDNISPNIAPSPEHFKKQLELVLRLAQINEQSTGFERNTQEKSMSHINFARSKQSKH